jgi:hypothetical protein
MPHLLQQVGVALYGAEWRAPLARALGSSSDRALRRWLAGEPVPAGVWEDLIDLCHKREVELAHLAEECGRRAED